MSCRIQLYCWPLVTKIHVVTSSIFGGRSYTTSCATRNRISRMLDMGGAPGASTTNNNMRLRNASKNSKVQAVAFDFELLVQGIHQDQGDDISTTPDAAKFIKQTPTSASTVTPDVDKVQQVADLLKVDLNQIESTTRRRPSYEKDDLSALTGGTTETSSDKQLTKLSSGTGTQTPGSLQDIRAKYAKKLHKKGVEGGLAGVDLVKHQREEALKRGDAEGHIAARKIAAASPGGRSSTKWMALTGTGKLLATLTHRSIKIGLLPRPQIFRNNGTELLQDKAPLERMKDLTRQLKDVVFDVIVDLPGNNEVIDETVIKNMVRQSLDQLELDPNVVLFVSDQDNYLRPAKDLGMITCRIRPLNARRGNISAHYTVERITQVQDVVNDMNGISFNAVLNM